MKNTKHFLVLVALVELFVIAKLGRQVAQWKESAARWERAATNMSDTANRLEVVARSAQSNAFEAIAIAQKWKAAAEDR